MKKRAKKAFNKNLKWILVLAVIVVIAMGFLLMLISGNEDRDQVSTDQNAAAQEQRQERTKAEKDDHPGVSDEALALYNAKVDDMSDAAAVAQLLETTTMRKELGGYIVTLNVKKEPKSLLISFEKPVLEAEQTAFDEAVTLYAQQLLAMIPEAGQVEWNYPLEKPKKTETVEVVYTVDQATEVLGMDVKDYNETPEMVQTLLHNQKGIR